VLRKVALFAVFSAADRGGKNASLAAQDLRSLILQSLLIPARLLVICGVAGPRVRAPLAASGKNELASALRFSHTADQLRAGITSHLLFLFRTSPGKICAPKIVSGNLALAV
jgi:hypothetical protein